METNRDSAARSNAAGRLGRFLLVTLIDVALALHLAAAGIYWWISPKGFPIDSGRFWLNSVLPPVLMAAAVAGLAGMYRPRYTVAALVVVAFAAAWCAAALAGRLVFPVSLRGFWILAMLIGMAGLACFGLLQSVAPIKLRTWLPAVLTGALIGVFAMRSQIAPRPSTRPVNAAVPGITGTNMSSPLPDTLQLGGGFAFDAKGGYLTLKTSQIQLVCRPSLEFDRISPDKFWSVFAPANDSPRRLVGHSASEDRHEFRYSDDSVVTLPGLNPAGSMEITSVTPLGSDTYSHLNSYCNFRITGHRNLALSFSPCPETRIDVLPADYPIGRPARLAYRNGADEFRVVEATSGEKGPFRELAVGRLGRGEPLVITVFDHGRSVAMITLHDWSQQASTDMSPTAGWRLPQNAIEFQRLGERAGAPVSIWITLAATSVGRGWEAVGHRAGTYRNRLTFNATAP